MKSDKTYKAKSRAQWRNWLSIHHDTEEVVWIIFDKKITGAKQMSYDDAVEEALCYGWIDSIIKKRDDNTYMRKFTPRKLKSRWSASNIKRIEKLRKEKKITKFGMAKIPGDLQERKTQGKYEEYDYANPPEIIKTAFSQNPKAMENFNSLAKSYKINYINWIMAGKKEETRIKRLNEAISLLEKNQKLGLK